MTKKSIAQVSSELYSLLEPFESEERLRIVKAALTLFGENTTFANTDGTKLGVPVNDGHNQYKGPMNLNEQAYFESKKPSSKVEELAVAARYRELKENANTSKRENMKAFYGQARINFDETHFARDIDNARKAGLFNKGGTASEGYTLSLYGQKYVDTLPDREAAKAIEKPIRKKARATKTKKGAK